MLELSVLRLVHFLVQLQLLGLIDMRIVGLELVFARIALDLIGILSLSNVLLHVFERVPVAVVHHLPGGALAVDVVEHVLARMLEHKRLVHAAVVSDVGCEVGAQPKASHAFAANNQFVRQRHGRHVEGQPDVDVVIERMLDPQPHKASIIEHVLATSILYQQLLSLLNLYESFGNKLRLWRRSGVGSGSCDNGRTGWIRLFRIVSIRVLVSKLYGLMLRLSSSSFLKVCLDRVYNALERDNRQHVDRGTAVHQHRLSLADMPVVRDERIDNSILGNLLRCLAVMLDVGALQDVVNRKQLFLLRLFLAIALLLRSLLVRLALLNSLLLPPNLVVHSGQWPALSRLSDTAHLRHARQRVCIQYLLQLVEVCLRQRL